MSNLRQPIVLSPIQNSNPGQIQQVDYSADGADVTVYRNVYSPDGTLFREDFIYTHYLPWQAIYEVAPGDSRLNQNTG